MPKDVFEFPCPCCGKRIELNTRTGRSRAVAFEESKDGKNLDDLISDQKQEGDRLGSMFDEAQKDHEGRPQHLDDLFSDAMDAAKDDDEKPPHPFLDS